MAVHGNAGTIGAACRPGYLRSLSAADPSKIHIIAIDYRGFGLSSGTPSEAGLIEDGLSAVRFAVDKLGIPTSRIAVLGQSLGTAVTFGVAEALAAQKPPQELAAVISIAGFSDMRELLLTYRAGGLVPILSPLRGYIKVQNFFIKFVTESWDSINRVASLVRNSPNLNLVLIHAKYDIEIPHAHSDALFARAANTAQKTLGREDITVEDVLAERSEKTYGNESSVALWPEEKSNGRKISRWIVEFGGHNQVVGSAGTSVIVAKALGL